MFCPLTGCDIVFFCLQIQFFKTLSNVSLYNNREGMICNLEEKVIQVAHYKLKLMCHPAPRGKKAASLSINCYWTGSATTIDWKYREFLPQQCVTDGFQEVAFS